jgi:tRNA pseudouridine38-40 synthase
MLQKSVTLKLTVAYDGSAFDGFQVQRGKDIPTIQGAFEDALRRLYGCDVCVHPSGRTDKGVHAHAQTISIVVSAKLPYKNLIRALNDLLPAAVRVIKVERVADGFNARFSSKKKTYEYLIDDSGSGTVFERNYVWQVRERLDVSAMRKAAKHLIGMHDFATFALRAAKYETCVRTMFAVTLKRRASDRIVIAVTADGFLQGMVRNIVGLLEEVGRGVRSPDDVVQLLAKKDRRAIGFQAPAAGLYLRRVFY